MKQWLMYMEPYTYHITVEIALLWQTGLHLSKLCPSRRASNHVCHLLLFRREETAARPWRRRSSLLLLTTSSGTTTGTTTATSTTPSSPGHCSEAWWRHQELQGGGPGQWSSRQSCPPCCSWPVTISTSSTETEGSAPAAVSVQPLSWFTKELLFTLDPCVVTTDKKKTKKQIRGKYHFHWHWALINVLITKKQLL